VTLNTATSFEGGRILSLPLPAPAEATAFAIAGKDPLLERLVHSLLPASQANQVLRGYYTDALHVTLLQRLERLRASSANAAESQGTIALPEWRLRRVYTFVERNLEERISLPALAQAAGLSRMHFAAVFRKATGLRPHDYVTRKRIERAQSLLTTSQESIIEIALSVGFQSQSHFTTVFRRLVGMTPNRWRLEHAAVTGLPDAAD